MAPVRTSRNSARAPSGPAHRPVSSTPSWYARGRRREQLSSSSGSSSSWAMQATCTGLTMRLCSAVG